MWNFLNAQMETPSPFAREGVLLATCLDGKEWPLIRYGRLFADSARRLRHDLGAIENGEPLGVEAAQKHHAPILDTVEMEELARVQGDTDAR